MTVHKQSNTFEDLTKLNLQGMFAEADYYVAEDGLTTILLTLQLGKPLLVDGKPGSGKTDGLNIELIQLQCYEGISVENTLYEWNYTKQFLAVRTGKQGMPDGSEHRTIFDKEYLLERLLLQSFIHKDDRPPVLLIYEVDCTGEELELFLLEGLSDFHVSISELGTICAEKSLIVIITSNQTHKLGDELKRQCLYLHIEPPSFEKKYKISHQKVSALDGRVIAKVFGIAQRLHEETEDIESVDKELLVELWETAHNARRTQF